MKSLRFRLFRFPIEIQPSFWLLAALLSLTMAGGSGGLSVILGRVLVLLGILFVSLMVHELGHAIAARAYGEAPRIELHALGGKTIWQPLKEPTRVQQVIVTAAGPVAGYGLALVAWLALLAGEGPEALGAFGPILSTLFILNLFWSTFNLLPVLPFDGGHIMAAVLGPKRERLALSISMGIGIAAALGFFAANLMFGGIILLWAAITSWSGLKRPQQHEIPPETLKETLRHAQVALQHERFPEAHAIARAVFEASQQAELRMQAAEIGAWSALLGGDSASARQVLERAPQDQPMDAYLRAAIEEAEGQDQKALEILEAARRAGDIRLELTALYIKVLLKLGDAERAARATSDIFEQTPSDDARKVAEEAFAQGAALPAAILFEHLFARAGEPEDGAQAARAFARAGHADAALKALEAAIAAGLALEGLREDESLQGLAADERFERLLSGGSAQP